MSFASLVEPVPHESRSEEESSEERWDASRLSRLMLMLSLAVGGACESFLQINDRKESNVLQDQEAIGPEVCIIRPSRNFRRESDVSRNK